MSKNIRIVYLYLVSLITLGMIVIGIVCTITATTSYFFPVVNYYNYYKEDELHNEYDYEEQLAINTRNEKKQSIREAISSVSIVAIGAPLYIYHFSKIQKERKEEV